MDKPIEVALEDGIDETYFREFDRFIRRYPLPLPLDEFMKLEMSFYRLYKRRNRRRHRGEASFERTVSLVSA